MLTDFLYEADIPCVSVPCGNGIRSLFALKLENCKIYVPFEFLDKAVNMLAQVAEHRDAVYRKDISDNIDKLKINSRLEKKLKKKLKILNEEDVIEFCRLTILRAQKFAEKGLIGSCVNGGHYVFIESENLVIIINSATYEILDVKTLNY